MLLLSHYFHMTKDEILEKIEGLASDLGGKYLHQTAINTIGQSVKRIIIEYENTIDENE